MHVYLRWVGDVSKRTVAGNHGSNIGHCQYWVELVWLKGHWNVLIPAHLEGREDEETELIEL